MNKLFILLLLILLSAPVYSVVESTPTIDHRNWQGYGVSQYGTREDNEYNTKKYKYDYTTLQGNQMYSRKAALISRPCRDMGSNGIVYEEPNCKIKENGSTWHPLIGWIKEDYGTITEYNIQWVIEPLRLYVYASNEDGNVVKYKIIENKQKSKIKQALYGSYSTYEPISYFVQTEIGEKPKNQGFKYDTNGKMISSGEKQTKFSEIVEYDMNGNILSIYRKNEWDRINEFEPDGKTLRTYHDTKYIPYLQWKENNIQGIHKTIDEFQANLFDR